MRARRFLLWALTAALLAACQPQWKPEQFAGKWKSSRVSTPLYLHPNGEWEIRNNEGRVLQYGIWQLQDRSILWTIRTGDGQVMHEANPIVSVAERRFELRETDGSLTKFERLD